MDRPPQTRHPSRFSLYSQLSARVFGVVAASVAVFAAALVPARVATAGPGADVLACARLDQSVCPALKLALVSPAKAAPELIAVLEAADTEAGRRAKAGIALGLLLGDKAAAPLLAAAKKQPIGSTAQADLYGAAARAGAKEAAPALMKLLTAGSRRDKVIACGALAVLGHKAAGPKLVPLLADDNAPRLQAAAAKALRAVGDASAAPALLALAADPTGFVPARRAALLALAKLSPKTALVTATRLIDHPTRSLGRAALAVIGAAPVRWTEPAVAFALQTPGLRGEAGLAAAKMKTLGRAVLVAALAADLSAHERAWLLHALTQLRPLGAGMALMETFGKLDDAARIEVLKTLPALKDRTVVPALVRELERDRKPVANYVVYALENLTGERLGGSVKAWRKYAGLDKEPGKKAVAP